LRCTYVLRLAVRTTGRAHACDRRKKRNALRGSTFGSVNGKRDFSSSAPGIGKGSPRRLTGLPSRSPDARDFLLSPLSSKQFDGASKGPIIPGRGNFRVEASLESRLSRFDGGAHESLNEWRNGGSGPLLRIRKMSQHEPTLSTETDRSSATIRFPLGVSRLKKHLPRSPKSWPDIPSRSSCWQGSPLIEAREGLDSAKRQSATERRSRMNV
jgi:hypothetical protein